MYVLAGNCLSKQYWETIDVTWGLRSHGVFSEGEWTAQIDGHIEVCITRHFMDAEDSSDEGASETSSNAGGGETTT